MATLDLSMSSISPDRAETVPQHPMGQSEPRNGILTPPITPDKEAERERRRRSIGKDSMNLVKNPSDELKSLLSVGVGLGIDPKKAVEDMLERNIDVGPLQFVPEIPRPYQGAYSLNKHILGYGAWSKVYSADEIPQASPLTPPNTPPRFALDTATQTLAVKRLTRRDGKHVIENEARILTYLHSHRQSLDHLVPFYGFETDTSSIILGLIPQTLEDHVRAKAALPVPTSTMFDPVIGTREWDDLALDLIHGLAYLHGKRCVHGDIKPANILLRPVTSAVGKTLLKPLFCDFSSSRVETRLGLDPTEEVSAVTAEYAAPELLRALNPRRRRDGDRPITTFSSDVFALAVTLLLAATGQSPYAQARLQIQKNAMAEEGLPLSYAQSSDQAARIREGGLVDRVLRVAVYLDPQKRISAKDWISHTQMAITI